MTIFLAIVLPHQIISINLKATIMKKMLRLGLVLVVAMTTMSTFANEGDFLLYVKKGNEKEIRFSLNGIKKINLALYDKENNLIYSENASGKQGILRTYRLEELPTGTYFLEVENEVKKVRYEIIVTNQMASLSQKAVTEVYKKVLRDKEGTLATL